MIKRAVKESGFAITEVICGMCRGADLAGKRWADKLGIPVKEMPAAWKLHNGKTDRAAGYKRNEAMARVGQQTILIYDGSSPGTGHMRDISNKKGLPIYILNLGDLK